MKLVKLFQRECWVDDFDYELPRPSNVIHLNTPHGRANAAQAAQLLEDDRRATRRDELRSDLNRQRNRLLTELARIDSALAELARG